MVALDNPHPRAGVDHTRGDASSGHSHSFLLMHFSNQVVEILTIEAMYHEFITAQKRDIEAIKREENLVLPENFDYRHVSLSPVASIPAVYLSIFSPLSLTH